MDNPLRRYLNAAGCTHDVLARRAGLSLDTLRSYVAGRRRPGLDAALAIARATKGAVPVEAWERTTLIRSAQ